MPKAPVESETVKQNPYITKGISKKFLTPCRQVGLSRKRKTPTSANDTLESTKNLVTNTTPVSSLKPSEEINPDKESQIELKEVQDVKDRRKSKVSKRLIADDDQVNHESENKTDLKVVQKRNVRNNKGSKGIISVGNDYEIHESKSKTELKEAEEKKDKRKRKPIKRLISEDLEDDNDSLLVIPDHTNKESQIELEEVQDGKNRRRSKGSKGVISADNNYEILESESKTELKEAEGEINKRKRKPIKRIISEDLEDDDDSLLVVLGPENKKLCKRLTEETSNYQQSNLNENEVIKSETKNKNRAKKSPKKGKNNVQQEVVLKLQEKNEVSTEVASDFEGKTNSGGNTRLELCNEHSYCTVIDKNETKIKEIKKCEVKPKNESVTEQQVYKVKSIEIKDKSPVVILKNISNHLNILETADTISNDASNERSRGPIIATSKNTKVKRSLSMKKSSSDEKNHRCNSIVVRENSIDLDVVEANLNPEVLPNEIKNLQKQIKEKLKLIEELKQAEIYKKKHNVRELEKLTTRYKTACISALSDLLPQLQQHASIDMAKLLENLGVPKEKITISPSGDLI